MEYPVANYWCLAPSEPFNSKLCKIIFGFCKKTVDFVKLSFDFVKKAVVFVNMCSDFVKIDEKGPPSSAGSIG
jgi:hypothetical protein